MNVAATTAAAEAASSQPQSTPDLGREDFLQLLVTQLRLQDPLEPVKEKDFIAQLAQFGTLEGVNNLSDEIKKLSDLFQTQLLQNAGREAVGLIGRRVTVTTENGSVTDVVTGVRWVDGWPQVVVGGEGYDLAQVEEVFLATAAGGEEASYAG
ncbi:MAG: flagellar basal-body rod modification protein FlgD [Bacillota bacterium]|nr:flagellar basal-body rod modification protein FlgD [Bacillota bacterium]